MKPLFTAYFLVLNVAFILTLSEAVSVHQRPRRANQLEIVKQKSVETPFLLSGAMQKFNNDLYQTLAKNQNGNLVISPFSIHTVMSMAMIGAPVNSSTYKQLSQALGITDPNAKATFLYNYRKTLDFYDNLVPDQLSIQTAYKVFINDGFQVKDDYIKALKLFYNTGKNLLMNNLLQSKVLEKRTFVSDLETVNFGNSAATANKINEFINDATNGLIKEAVQPSSFDALTKMAMVNAIYFKGTWKSTFDKEKTKPMQFTKGPGDAFEYPHGMNIKTTFKNAVLDKNGAKTIVLELPYTDPKFVMYLILPPEDKDIDDFDIESIDLKNVGTKLRPVFFQLTVPKFKIEYDEKLKEKLTDMGVSDIFSSSRGMIAHILFLSVFSILRLQLCM